MNNTWKRKLLAFAAIALLSVPSAIGVQRALAPTRGDLAGWLAAGGFELVYLSTAALLLRAELRAYAQRVALAAVATAVVLNTLADYAHRVPGGLAGWRQFSASFDGLALVLSIVESAPLAALAYAMAVLLHRLSEVPETPPPAPAPAPAPEPEPALTLARQETYPAPVAVAGGSGVSTCQEAPAMPALRAPIACPHCGASLPNAGAKGRAVRYGYCQQCKPT